MTEETIKALELAVKFAATHEAVAKAWQECPAAPHELSDALREAAHKAALASREATQKLSEALFYNEPSFTDDYFGAYKKGYQLVELSLMAGGYEKVLEIADDSFLTCDLADMVESLYEL